PALTSDRVARSMASKWVSAPFETATIRGTTYVGRAYGSPLYADGVRVARGPAVGESLSVVFVATSNGDVYAVSATDTPCNNGTLPAGSVLWRTHIAAPEVPPKLDGREDGPE